MGGGFLLQGAVSSETVGALGKRADIGGLFDLFEDGLAGEGGSVGAIVGGHGDIESLTGFQEVAYLRGREHEVADGQCPLLPACNVFLPVLLGGAGFLDESGLRLYVVGAYASGSDGGAVLREYELDVFACHVLILFEPTQGDGLRLITSMLPIRLCLYASVSGWRRALSARH